MNEVVHALAVYDDGSGPALYAGGEFVSAGGGAANGIAKWNGSGWSAVGGGVNTYISALAVYDDGSGPALYAGGGFTTAGGVAANRIAKWDGSRWAALGSGMSWQVSELVVYDDGDGPALYAGGGFTTAGGVTASRIAKWDGSSWSALGSGVTDVGIQALVVHDDGSGPALYAGGASMFLGGVLVRHIGKWDGTSWKKLGHGTLGTGTDFDVQALVEYDDGHGPALYAGGYFTTAGSVQANRIAKWDGGWHALGSGLNGQVNALAVYEDGGGPALYAAGTFTTAGGVAANKIAKFNGSSWAALGGGMNDNVRALAVYDEGSGPALYAGGSFRVAYDSGDSYLAKWGIADVPPVLSCPAFLTVLDRSSDGQEVVNFTVTATDDCDPAPAVVCVPPSGSTFPRGTTLVHCTATDASGNQSTCQFPVILSLRVRLH